MFTKKYLLDNYFYVKSFQHVNYVRHPFKHKHKRCCKERRQIFFVSDKDLLFHLDII